MDHCVFVIHALGKIFMDTWYSCIRQTKLSQTLFEQTSLVAVLDHYSDGRYSDGG